MYGAQKVQKILPGHCMSAGARVQDCGATNTVPTHKDIPLLSLKRRPHFQTHKQPWNKHKLG
jgi:hypothetical protein